MANNKSILTEAKKIIQEEADAVINLAKQLDDNFIKAIDLIYNCKGRLIITGMGKSGIIGKKIAATMASTGTLAYFLHPADGIHGDLGMIAPDDVVIMISKSGDTEEINNLIPSMNLMGVKIIAITAGANSTLAKHSDIVLNIGTKEEVCPLGLAPTTSTTLTLVLGDALAIALLNKKKFKKEDFAFFHPGGMLGRKLLIKVESLMHTGNAVPIVKESSNFNDALYEMTSKRLGMTCVVDKKGKLTGIFTDGDLRRVIEKEKNIYSLIIDKIMTKNPKMIDKSTLAFEALKKMEDHQITSLVITNNKKEPIGVIHLHDIIKAGIK